MFPILKNEIDARFATIEEYFGATASLQEHHLAVAKGLMFVQIYAIYEYTVNKAVSETIESIKTHNHKMMDLSPSLLSLFLDPELRSLRDGPRRNEWSSRLKLFDQAFGSHVVTLSGDTNPPSDNSHYRYSQLVLIFKVFGISRMPVPRRRHIQRIGEVVDHRNAIAHGRETAEDIGRRYTRSDIRKVIRQMKSVCMLLIRVLDAYCADPSRHLR